MGTGETLKRSAVDSQAPPPKPPRSNSVADLLEDFEQDNEEGGVREDNEEGGVRENNEEGGVDNEKKGEVKKDNEGRVDNEKEDGVEGADMPVEEDTVKQQNNAEVEQEIEESGLKPDDNVPNQVTLSSQRDRNNSTTTNECEAVTTINTNTTDLVTHDNGIVDQSNQCDNNKPEVITQSPLTGEPPSLTSGCGLISGCG